MTWTKPPEGAAAPEPQPDLRDMKSDARYRRVETLAEDLANRFDNEVMELMRASGGAPYDYHVALTIAIRALARHLLGTLTTYSLERGDVEDAKGAPQQVVKLLTFIAEEIASVEIEEIDVPPGALPENVSRQIDAKIAESGLDITALKVVRIGNGFTVMAVGNRKE